MESFNKRNLIQGVDSENNIVNFKVDSLGRIESSSMTGIFGEQITAHKTPVIQVSNKYNIDPANINTLEVYEATTKTLEQCLVIEKRFKFVSEALLNGDWKSALHHIDNVKPNVYLEQSLIDQVKSDINNYITANYSW